MESKIKAGSLVKANCDLVSEGKVLYPRGSLFKLEKVFPSKDFPGEFNFRPVGCTIPENRGWRERFVTEVTDKEFLDAYKWVESGCKCVYRYGFEFKGSGASIITKEEALKKILNEGYHFGMGFYTMSWIRFNGEKVLEFNELSENDMF